VTLFAVLPNDFTVQPFISEVAFFNDTPASKNEIFWFVTEILTGSAANSCTAASGI
jgi:hypothetical protein